MHHSTEHKFFVDFWKYTFMRIFIFRPSGGAERKRGVCKKRGVSGGQFFLKPPTLTDTSGGF